MRLDSYWLTAPTGLHGQFDIEGIKKGRTHGFDLRQPGELWAYHYKLNDEFSAESLQRRVLGWPRFRISPQF